MRTLLLAGLVLLLGLLLVLLVGCKGDSEPEAWGTDICNVIQQAMGLEQRCCDEERGQTAYGGACGDYADFMDVWDLSTAGSACYDFAIDVGIYDEHCR